MFGDVGVLVANPLTAFTVSLEGKGGLHQWTRIAKECLNVGGVSISFVELGFGIEHVDGTGSTFHKQPNDGLGLGRKMTRTRFQGRDGFGSVIWFGGG